MILMPTMNDVDVVIVHYSSVEDLGSCLASLECEHFASLTIVDNASPCPVPPDLVSHQEVRVVRLSANVGFGLGVNIGVKEGRAPLVLIVNPDVRVSNEALSQLRTALGETDEIAAVAPRLLLEGGEPQVGAAGYFPTYGAVIAHAFPALGWWPARWTSRPLFLRETEWNQPASPTITEVDWVSGACLLIKRSAFEAVGGFDDRFFMYGEDIDLCRRFAQRGWRVRYSPGTAVTHTQRALGPEWIEGLDHYYRIHSPRARRALHGILAVGLGARAAAYGLKIAGEQPARPGARRVAGYARRAAWLAIGP